ncbi:MAG: manganese efflux pump MntP [Henriciella sp.]
MSIQIVLPTALALSTDAFAVSVAKGTRAKQRSLPDAVRIGLLFGGFEAGMCALGWALANVFADAIRSIDHWIALILLGGVGLKMIFDAVGQSTDEHPTGPETTRAGSPILWLLTAMGTSIDAAAVGIALSFTQVSLWLAVPMIGLVSGTMSATGYYIAPTLGKRFGERAEIVGGIVLILIGAGIFYSHQFGGHA